MAVKMAIEAADQQFLGVDITMQSAALSVCKGYVKIEKLRVHQPEFEMKYERKDGKLVGTKTEPEVKLEWKEDYIFKVKTLLVKINLWRLAKTLGKEFELENLTLLGVHANVEKPDTNLKAHNSNVEYVINFIDALGLLPPPEEAAAAPKAAEEKEEEAADLPKVILRKIEVGDICAAVRISKVPLIGEFSFAPSLGIIEFNDIQKDIFNDREDLTPAETVACIVNALGKKIVKMVVEEIPKKLKQKAKEGVNAMFTSVPKKLEGCLAGVSAAACSDNPSCLPQRDIGKSISDRAQSFKDNFMKKPGDEAAVVSSKAEEIHDLDRKSVV